MSSKDKDLDKDRVNKKNYHEGHRERMRNRFDKDPELVTAEPHEVLEYLLSLVIPRRDTNELAHELMAHFGSIGLVLLASPRELYKIKGMTRSAAYLLPSILPIARLANSSLALSELSPRVSKLSECEELMRAEFLARRNENVAVQFLDINFKIVGKSFQASYAGSSVEFDVSKLVSDAIRVGASYVIVGHNHPSGDPRPSNEDIDTSRSLFNALAAVGIRLVDSVVFANNRVFSFYNNSIISMYESDLSESQAKALASNPNERIVFAHDLREYIVDTYGLLESKELVVEPIDSLVDESFALDRSESISEFQRRLIESHKKRKYPEDF